MDSCFNLAAPLLNIKLTIVNVEITTHSRNFPYEIYDGAFNFIYIKRDCRGSTANGIGFILKWIRWATWI